MSKIVKYLIRVWQRLIRRIPANISLTIKETSCGYNNGQEAAIGIGKIPHNGPNIPIVLTGKDAFLKVYVRE